MRTALFATFLVATLSVSAQVELLAPGIISTGDDEAHATYSPDGKQIFFIKDSPDFAHWTVIVVGRKGGSVLEPEVAWFSGRYSDADVSFDPSGETIYFISNRPVAPDGEQRHDTEIWRMRRTASGWSEPEHVAELTSDGNEWFPNMTSDGWLYFGSERRDGNLGREGTSDLWRARLVNGRFTKPENLGPLFSTMNNDIEPWISSDGTLMIFASNGRSDTLGSYDLYASRRCGDRWTTPHHLGGGINSSGWDFGPRVTPDGEWLLLTSNRTDSDRPYDRPLRYRELLSRIRSAGNGLRDIYRVPFSAIDLGPPCEAAAK